MKFKLTLAAIAGLALASCNTGSNERIEQIPLTAYNVIGNVETGETTVSASYYDVKLTYSEGKMELTSSNLSFDNKNHLISAEASPFYISGRSALFAVDFQGTCDFNQMNPVLGSMFLISRQDFPDDMSLSGIYTPTVTGTDGKKQYIAGALYTNDISENNWRYGSWMVTSYNIGNTHTVKTLINDAFYFGTTRTRDDESNYFETKDAYYRVIMDVPNKKANVLIYNVKFADKAPLLNCIWLKDLDVNFHDGVYDIEGQNVVPISCEGKDEKGETIHTPFDRFTFDTFKLINTNQYLTSALIQYTVAGKYEGMFEGSTITIPTPSSSQQPK